MSINKTTTDLSTLKINYLTQEMYEDALENNEINENELYVTPGGEGGGGAIDATSIPTANKVAKFDTEARMNSEDMSSTEVNNFVGNLGYTFNLIDMFYPVGSYYETSDTTFNPNITWGGTWALMPQHDVIGDSVPSKTLAANSNTEMCTVTLDANTRYIILGSAGTGSASAMTSNCDLNIKSGTYHTWLKFITNSTSSSAGSTLNASGYIYTDTSCVISLNKYNYTSSAISTGNGNIVAIPLSGIDEAVYCWHRTA